MEPEEDGGWRNKMKKYFRSIEILTVDALKEVKQDLSMTHFRNIFCRKLTLGKCKSQTINSLRQID